MDSCDVRDVILCPESSQLISQILNPGRGAVGPAPPRGIPVPRYVCGLCVPRGYGTRGYGTMTNRAHEQALRTGHACGDANDTTEPHTIAYASYSIMHIMPARKLVCVLRVYMYGVWHADGMRDRQTGHGGGATLCVLLPRPRPADLAGRCGIPKTRDNDGFSQKAFSCA